jgi:hypothetical protein
MRALSVETNDFALRRGVQNRRNVKELGIAVANLKWLYSPEPQPHTGILLAPTPITTTDCKIRTISGSPLLPLITPLQPSSADTKTVRIAPCIQEQGVYKELATVFFSKRPPLCQFAETRMKTVMETE